MSVAPPPTQEKGRRDEEGRTQMEGRTQIEGRKCCEKAKQLCHIYTLEKEEQEKEENEWIKCGQYLTRLPLELSAHFPG